MAAEMINEILKAEADAAAEEQRTRKKAEELIEYAEKKSQDLYDEIITEAKYKADAVIADAEARAEEYMLQSKNLSKLRKKSVIGETESRYDEAISEIIKTLTED